MKICPSCKINQRDTSHSYCKEWRNIKQREYNKTYRNEFWTPLFEKALAKFMGSYDELEGGIFENSALFLSGGIHDTYLIEDLVSTDSANSELDDCMPTVKELLEIIKLAIQQKNMIGCIMENVMFFLLFFNYVMIG